MIRLGVCTKPENAELVGRLGFDFIEMSLAWLEDLSWKLGEETRRTPDLYP